MDPETPPVEVDLDKVRALYERELAELNRKKARQEEMESLGRQRCCQGDVANLNALQGGCDVDPTRNLSRLWSRRECAGNDGQRQMPGMRHGLECEQRPLRAPSASDPVASSPGAAARREQNGANQETALPDKNDSTATGALVAISSVAG